MRMNFIPINVFRETPQISFFDARVKSSNSTDVVIHHKNAISPTDDWISKQYYIHQHQIDHNLVVEGSRTFTLINPNWDEPHHVIFFKSINEGSSNTYWNLSPLKISKRRKYCFKSIN